MKTTMFVLAAAVAMFLFGCQDNSSTNPIVSEQLSATPADLSKPMPQVIILQGFLRDPIPFNNFVEINGQVAVTTCGQALCDITLSTSADLTPMDQLSDDNTWKVSGGTCDKIKLLAGSSVTLEKAYRVEGRNDGTFLHLSFLVSRDKFGISRSVQLNGMWLAKHRERFPAETNAE